MRWLMYVFFGVLAAGSAHAATFTLPGALGTAPFNTCSATTFNCSSSVSIGNNDEVNVTSSVTLNINGNFTVGTGTTFNVLPGRTLTIVATGNISIGNNATVTANLQAGGSLSTGTGATVIGNLSSTGATSLGNNSTVNGNVTASGIGFGTGSAVNGTCTPSAPQCVGAFTLSKTASSPTVPANTNYTFTLTARNTTAAAINGVVVTDDLVTPGLNWVSCSATIGTCTSTGVWTVGTLNAGATATATLVVQSPTAGTVLNTITSPGAASASAVVQIYAPLVDWRMDEPFWNGTPIEVKDSTGNGYNGTAARAVLPPVTTPPVSQVPTTANTSPAFSSGGRSTCGYGVFGSPSNPLGYVALAGVPPLPTSFTFTAWIRSTDARRTGQRILVRDDAQNGWGFSLGDGARVGDTLGRIRFFNRNFRASGTVSGTGLNNGCGPTRPVGSGVDPNPANNGTFCLDTAAVISNNNWFFVALTIDTVGKNIAHFVYNAAGALVSTTSSAFDTTQNWVDGPGTASLGGETRDSSEGRGTDFHFQGNIDEMQIYQGVLAPSDFALLLTRSRTCPGSGPDHVELVHDGAGLTCSPKAVRVLGCTSASSCRNTVADQFVGNVTFTPATFPGAQWCFDATCTSLASGSLTVPSGTTLYLREPTARTDLLSGTVTGALNNTLQCANSATSAFGTSPAACNLTFNNAGFLVSVPNHTSCTPQQVTIQAVQANATGTACVPSFNGVNRNVSLYSSYANPTTGTQTASFSYWTSASGATTSSVAALSTNSASPTTLSNLYFDATGTARLTGFRYPDAGQVTLVPGYTGSLATNDAGLVLGPASGGTFVAAPAGFAFSGIPAAPLVAGDPFNVTLTARNTCSTPGTTPNFGREATPATVTLTSTNPLPGAGNSVAINQTASGFVNGVGSSNVTWREVGTVDLLATSSNYLASGLSPSSTQSAVGRFRPAYFDTAVTQACGAFTYSGQPLQQVTVTARATGGSTTANYGGATWARQVTLSDANATPGTWAGNTISAATFSNGAGSTSTAAFTFAAKATPPTSIRVRAAEPAGADGVSSATAPGLEGAAPLRSGRVRLSNAYGSELLALPIPTAIEFFDTTPAAGWRTGADTCTVLSASNFAWTFPVATPNRLQACETAVTVAGANPTPAVRLSAPGAANNGWADLTLNLGAPAAGSQCTTVGGTGPAATSAGAPWLRFPWTGGADINPTARATFGVYRSPLIYRRENY